MQGWRELARAVTASGDELLLRERAGTFEIRCNGWDLMSSRAHHSERCLARLVCEPLHADAPRVLIGGLGMGYTLRAALDALPAGAEIVVAELLPEIIAWNRGMLGALAGQPLDDPRVRIVCADVATLLRPAGFDAIVLDVDNGPDAVMLHGNDSLYSTGGLGELRNALRADGILGVWSADASPRFEENLREAGFAWERVDVPARGADDDPLHSIYVAGASRHGWAKRDLLQDTA